jgi:hypothetical protein
MVANSSTAKLMEGPPAVFARIARFTVFDVPEVKFVSPEYTAMMPCPARPARLAADRVMEPWPLLRVFVPSVLPVVRSVNCTVPPGMIVPVAAPTVAMKVVWAEVAAIDSTVVAGPRPTVVVTVPDRAVFQLESPL